MSLILMLNFSLSMIMMFLKHPLSMGLNLLIQTLLITLIMELLNFNFWYSYILFLIMISGMLILFIYMTSIASNEKFKISINLTWMFTILFLMSISSMLFKFINFYMKLENKYNLNIYTISLNKFINNPLNIILFLIIMYLFTTLIAIVKISNIKLGPLRQKFQWKHLYD